jgi:hypothetical protein
MFMQSLEMPNQLLYGDKVCSEFEMLRNSFRLLFGLWLLVVWHWCVSICQG